MDYIKKLDRLRILKNMSFYELALQCDLSESCIKKIFYEKSIPLVTSIQKICDALDCSMAELFCTRNEIVMETSHETASVFSLFDSLPGKAKIHLLNLFMELIK